MILPFTQLSPIAPGVQNSEPKDRTTGFILRAALTMTHPWPIALTCPESCRCCGSFDFSSASG